MSAVGGGKRKRARISCFLLRQRDNLLFQQEQEQQVVALTEEEAEEVAHLVRVARGEWRMASGLVLKRPPPAIHRSSLPHQELEAVDVLQGDAGTTRHGPQRVLAHVYGKLGLHADALV